MVNERLTAVIIWPVGTMHREIPHEHASEDQGHHGHGEDRKGHN
jgi:hypothetical protein